MSLAQKPSGPALPDETGQWRDIVDRVKALEAKVDIVRVHIEQMEASSDHNWRALAANAADGPISPLASEFVTILAQRDRLLAQVRDASANATWTAEREAEAAGHLDPLWARLMQLAAAFVELPAATLADLRAKALAIKELSEEDSDDIVHRLAASLATDLLARQPLSGSGR